MPSASNGNDKGAKGYAFAPNQPAGRKALFVQPVGYYKRGDTWYGPCSTVIVWAKEGR